MAHIPLYIPVVFIATTLTTLFIFYQASKRSRTTLLLMCSWLFIQSGLALSGFYQNTSGMPPRFLLIVLPPLVLIAGLFSTGAGRRYLDALDLKTLTLLHSIRIPVEVVLFWLFVHKAVPQVMTFEGRNFDVVSGLTAPLVFYLFFYKKSIGRNVLLLWNVICLGLLVNVVAIAVLTLPLPFQQLAFDQPNVAVLYFPFVLLPGIVVPLVLLSHLAAIRQLLVKTTAVQTNSFNTDHTAMASLSNT